MSPVTFYHPPNNFFPTHLPSFVLLTCHTPGFSLQRLTNLLESAAKDVFGGKFSRKRMSIDAQTLLLRAESGVTLPSGESVMFCSNDYGAVNEYPEQMDDRHSMRNGGKPQY